MPSIVIAAALAGAAAGVGFTVAAGFTFAFSWSAFATSLLLGAAAQAFTKKPAQNSLQSKGQLVTVRQPISYWQVVVGKTAAQGVLTFRYVSADRQQWHMVLTFACHEIEAFDGIYFNDELITLDGSGNATGKYAGYVRIKQSLGVAGEGQPFPDLVAESGGVWSNDHLQDGHAKLYVRLTANPNLFPTGVPSAVWVVARGAKLYDPRTATTVYSNNPGLAVANILTSSDYGFGAVFADEIDSDDLEASANTCDEAVSLAAGGTESRYTANGTFLASETPKDVIVRLNAAMAGKLVYVGDKFHVLAGGYTAPTVTLDEDDFAGPVTLQAHLDDRDNANSVRGTFNDPNSSWQPTDFPALQSATYIAEDNGEVQWQDLDFTAFVTSVTQAQRLAKIMLLSIRQGSTLSAAFKMPAYGVMPGKTVAVNLAKYGLVGKVYEVVECGLNVVADQEGARLQVPLALRETAAAIFDWTTDEEAQQDFAPNTTLPDASSGLTIENLSASSGTADLLVNGDGTVVPRVRLRWTEPTNAFLKYYEVQYARTDTTPRNWADAPRITAPASEGFVAPVKDGVEYDLQIRAVTSGTFQGDWAQVLAHTVIGKTEKPTTLTSFTIEGKRLAWGEVSDADLDGYRIRYQPGLLRSWGDAIPMHQGLLTESPWDMKTIPVGLVTLMIRGVDTSGNESADSAYIITDFGDPEIANVMTETDRQADGWPGTLSSGTVDGSNNLVADSTTLMWNASSSANWWSGDDSTLLWSTSAYTQMIYTDQVSMFGALDGSMLTLTATIQGDPWQVEYRESGGGTMWSAGSGTLMWSAASSDAMWGSQDWRAWPGQIQVSKSDYEFRVTTGQGTTQGEVSQFVLTLDAPDLEELLNDISISAAGTRLSPTKNFTSIGNVQLTLQADGGTAVKAQTEDKSVALGPLVKCYDASNVATTGLVDARIRGY